MPTILLLPTPQIFRPSYGPGEIFGCFLAEFATVSFWLCNQRRRNGRPPTPLSILAGLGANPVLSNAPQVYKPFTVSGNYECGALSGAPGAIGSLELVPTKFWQPP